MTKAQQSGKSSGHGVSGVGVFVMAMLAFSMTACCGGKHEKTDEHISPIAATATATAATAKAAPAAPPAATVASWGTGTIDPPPSAANSQRRGIVRATPEFTGSEVARIDQGTRVNIITKESNGFYQISWPLGVNTFKGYVHGDVMKVAQGGK